MNNKVVVIRADGNSEIGMGHFMRSLALAEILSSQFKIIFVTTTPNDFQISEMNKICHAWIGLSSSKMHYSEFLELLKGDEIVVLDNYYYGTEYQVKIKNKGCKLVCVDDVHRYAFVADVVINHAEYSTKSHYKVSDYTKLCLGHKYAILRKTYLENLNLTSSELDKESILICIGGVDKFGIGLKIAKWMLESNLVRNIKQIQIVNSYSKELLEFARKLGVEINFHQQLNPERMKELFKNATLGVFPASTIAIESCSMRLPFITGYYVDNQKNILNGLTNNELAVSAGNLLNVKREEFDLILQKTLGSVDYREKSVTNMIKSLDKKSPQRLKNIFAKL
jgi:UDP-2,4-diacetamido-2,4,6-trideoxy-beta-L-altropyranose hydrolase